MSYENSPESKGCSPASDLGYKVGDLFKVINHQNSFYTDGMIVKFQEDDGSNSPWFTYVSGPTSAHTFTVEKFCIMLPALEKIESTNESINVTYSEEDIKAAIVNLNWMDDDITSLMNELKKCKEPEYKEYLRLKAKYEN